MWRHLAQQGAAASAGRVQQLQGFRASLARHAHGIEKYDDPFGKLKQDLLQSASLGRPELAATLPEHHCGRHHGHGGARQRYRASKDGEATMCASEGGGSCRRARKAARKAARSERAVGRGIR